MKNVFKLNSKNFHIRILNLKAKYCILLILGFLCLKKKLQKIWLTKNGNCRTENLPNIWGVKNCCSAKGQLFSKGLFVINKLENFIFCPCLLGQKFLVCFLEELKTRRSPFEINWPLKLAYFWFDWKSNQHLSS